MKQVNGPLNQRLWIAIVGALWLGTAAAQTPRIEAPSAEEVQQRLEAAKSRLNLTPEQEQRLRPVVEEEAKQLREIQQKYGGTTSRQDKRTALQEARAVQQDFRAKLEGILTPEQIGEWNEMRSEARERFRQRRSN
jgi:Spy/CpxP family protein refolding chaperone